MSKFAEHGSRVLKLIALCELQLKLVEHEVRVREKM